MMQDRVLSMLGLAMKGNHAVSGEFQTVNAVRDGSAALVLVAEDASENTKKLFRDKCSFYEVKLYLYGTKESLGKAMGKEIRSCAAVTSAGLAKSIINRIESNGAPCETAKNLNGKQRNEG